MAKRNKHQKKTKVTEKDFKKIGITGIVGFVIGFLIVRISLACVFFWHFFSIWDKVQYMLLQIYLAIKYAIISTDSFILIYSMFFGLLLLFIHIVRYILCKKIFSQHKKKYCRIVYAIIIFLIFYISFALVAEKSGGGFYYDNSIIPDDPLFLIAPAIIAKESYEDFKYLLKGRYYCEQDKECEGSIEGEGGWMDQVCDVTECINSRSSPVHKWSRYPCEYRPTPNYGFRGGRCKCIENRCTALEIIDFQQVTLDYCNEIGLDYCEPCNFQVPKGWGLKVYDWRQAGFNCTMKARGGGLKLYKYEPCKCGTEECIDMDEDIYFFIFDEIVADMRINKITKELSAKCFNGTVYIEKH